MRTFLEFFAGAGMATIGLGEGWHCLFANDFDQQKAASYRANHNGGHLLVADVAALTLADLPPGVADLAWASSPCQDVSLAGARAGLDGSRSGACWPWLKLMKGLVAEGRAPRLLVVENVVGLLTSSKGEDFKALCEELVDAGYLIGALMIDAELFLPQSRVRMFIIAIRAHATIPRELTQGSPTEPFHTKAMTKAVAKFPPAVRSAWRWWRLPVPLLRNTTLLDLVDFDAPCDDDAETRRLIELMAPLHVAKVDEARAAGGLAVGAICRRMRDGEQRAEIRFDRLAHALRTPGGGSSIQRFLLIDGATTRSRRPTPRECARLMGLPDTYVLPNSTQDAYHLTGDGVAVPVVRWLAEQIDGDANCNVVLSCQVVILNRATGRHCKILMPIDAPNKRKRFTLAAMLGVALRWAKHEGVIPDFPDHVFLVGHFTRADLTALKDWPKFKDKFFGVRKTLASPFKPHKVLVSRYKNRSDYVWIKVTLVDTMLLAPARSSLAKLGALVGLPKIELPPGVIERMDLLQRDDPELFERYAMRDAEIAAFYYASICKTLKSEFGVEKLVVTLGAAGVQMLLGIMPGLGFNADAFFGYQRVPDIARQVINECAAVFPFAANCYHGGRNEAYWLGPTQPLGDCASIGDFDLCGAYTTAMTLIREPLWSSNCHEKRLERLAVVEEAMTFALVRFEFPPDRRFPCLSVRAGERGLLYPLTGESWCTGPELVVALSQGAKIEVLDGCRVEWVEGSESPFLEFTRRIDQIRKKAKAEKNELLNQTAKEVGNSLYGKTAQAVESMRSIHDGGVDGKTPGRRAFNCQTGTTETLPPSRITCPPIAAYTTGLVRAALSEALARLPAGANVYSATTDGFLAEIGMDQIDMTGPAAQAFSAARVRIDGNPAIWELKHEIDEAIIIKTRGAITTRLHGNDTEKVVLAQAGYRLEKLEKNESPWEKCQKWERIYREREYETPCLRKVFPSLREQWIKEIDLVEKTREVRLNFDADLKREPFLLHDRDGLLVAATRPWRTLEEFTAARDALEAWRKSMRRVLKTLADWRDFETWRAEHEARRASGGTAKSKRPPLVGAILRGLATEQIEPAMSQAAIALLITGAGYPCSVQNVKDAKRRGRLKLGEINRLSPQKVAFALAVGRLRPEVEIERLLTPAAASKFLCTNDFVHNLCAAQ